MNTKWLTPDDIAERLCIARRTAMSLMYQMPHSIISGTTRKRVRVSEANFETWMFKHSNGKPVLTLDTGASNRKLTRREA